MSDETLRRLELHKTSCIVCCIAEDFPPPLFSSNESKLKFSVLSYLFCVLCPSHFLGSEEWLEWMVLPLGLVCCVLTALHPSCLRMAPLQVNDKLGNQTTILLGIPREKSSYMWCCGRKWEAWGCAVVVLWYWRCAVLQMERTDPQLLSKEVTGTLPVAVQWQWQHTEQNPRARRMKGFWRGRADKSQVGKCCYEKPELQMAWETLVGRCGFWIWSCMWFGQAP